MSVRVVCTVTVVSVVAGENMCFEPAGIGMEIEPPLLTLKSTLVKPPPTSAIPDAMIQHLVYIVVIVPLRCLM